MDMRSPETATLVRIESPVCGADGCRSAPTLAKANGEGWVYRCDRHRDDKRKEYQRNANWRHKLKVKYGIKMPRQN